MLLPQGRETVGVCQLCFNDSASTMELFLHKWADTPLLPLCQLHNRFCSYPLKQHICRRSSPLGWSHRIRHGDFDEASGKSSPRVESIEVPELKVGED